MLAFTHRRSAFTILEIAVVLTAIGLIIGGILIGGSVIRNAELQSLVSDVNRFKSAAKMFRDKYKYLPGDFPNAGSLWGRDTGCTAGPPDTDATTANRIPKKETCGGDGNGLIGGYDGTNYPSASSNIVGIGGKNREAIRVWQHLVNAQLIDGIYTGASSTITAVYEPGINIPMRKLDMINGYIFFYAYAIDASTELPNNTPDDFVFPGTYGHIIEYGQPSESGSASGLAKVLDRSGITTENARSIDLKMDDGRPGTGNVLSFTPDNEESTYCATSSDPALANYNTDLKDIACALIFVTGL